MLKRQSKHLTYPDGWGAIYAVTDRRYIEGSPKQAIVHFAEKTVGEQRFWDAYVNGVEISRVVAVPIGTAVEMGDLMLIEGAQYIVAQKQRQDDTKPQSWLLSLQKSPIEYRVKDVPTPEPTPTPDPEPDGGEP